MRRFCGACGKDISPEHGYCGRCGTPASESAEVDGRLRHPNRPALLLTLTLIAGVIAGSLSLYLVSRLNPDTELRPSPLLLILMMTGTLVIIARTVSAGAELMARASSKGMMPASVVAALSLIALTAVPVASAFNPHLTQRVGQNVGVVADPNAWRAMASVSWEARPAALTPLAVRQVPQVNRSFAITSGADQPTVGSTGTSPGLVQRADMDRVWRTVATDAANKLFTESVLPYVYTQFGKGFQQAEISIGLEILSRDGIPLGRLTVTTTCRVECVVSSQGATFVQAESSTVKTWRPARRAMANTQKGLALYQTATIGMTILQGAAKFVETVDYIASAVQTMNPPDPLNPPTVTRAGPGLIKWTSTRNYATPSGSFSHKFEQTMPANLVERFVLPRRPPGSYFDGNSPWTETTTTSLTETWGPPPVDTQRFLLPPVSTRPITIR